MTKRIISLLLVTVMLLSMTSCSKKEQNLDVENMTLEEYIDKVKLPKNLTVSIDPATVTNQTTVYTYDKVEYMDFDIDWLAERLLENPVTEKEIGLWGDMWSAKTDTKAEYLYIYDGGKASSGSVEVSQAGGFQYSWDADKRPSWWLALSNSNGPELYTRTNGQLDYILTSLYDSAAKELDFASREKIADKAITFFQEAGVPNVKMHEIVACDLDVLKSEYARTKKEYEDDLVNNSEFAAEMSAEYNVLEPQQSDENYWVICRQLIDNIPVDTYNMEWAMESPWPYSQLSLQYTEEGIVNTYVIDVVKQPEQSSGTEESIINAASALELVKKYYGNGILLDPHNIESLELVYKVHWDDKEKVASLVPFWLARISYSTTVKESDEKGQVIEEKEVTGYDHLYFNAITGEYLDESTSANPIE